MTVCRDFGRELNALNTALLYDLWLAKKSLSITHPTQVWKFYAHSKYPAVFPLLLDLSLAVLSQAQLFFEDAEFDNRLRNACGLQSTKVFWSKSIVASHTLTVIVHWWRLLAIHFWLIILLIQSGRPRLLLHQISRWEWTVHCCVVGLEPLNAQFQNKIPLFNIVLMLLFPKFHHQLTVICKFMY